MSQREVEKVLGVKLPQSVSEAQTFVHKPSALEADFTAYIRLKLPEDAYNDLKENLGLQPIKQTEYALLLPGKWKLGSGVRLDWWKPTADIPDNGGAIAFGTGGWIIAKYEAGYAYLRVHDPGTNE